MSCKVIVDDISHDEWSRYAGEFGDYSIYQTWPYQEVRARTDGQDISRALIKDSGGKILTMCHVRIRRVRVLGLSIGYIQWGPLVQDKNGSIKCSIEALKALRETYLGTKVNVLRIVPNVCKNQNGYLLNDLLRAGGFEYVPIVKSYRTIIVPLDCSQEYLRKMLRKSWRRDLKKAEKVGMCCVESHDSDYFHLLKEFYDKLVKKKKFIGLDLKIFLETQELLSESEKMSFIVAYLADQPVAVLLAGNLGNTAVILFSATNEEGLSCGASYLIWWKALLSAQRLGFKNCDLGGIDPEDNPGVYTFKSRMGGEEQYHIGAFEAYTNVPIRRLWRVTEKVYNFIKKKP